MQPVENYYHEETQKWIKVFGKVEPFDQVKMDQLIQDGKADHVEVFMGTEEEIRRRNKKHIKSTQLIKQHEGLNRSQRRAAARRKN